MPNVPVAAMVPLLLTADFHQVLAPQIFASMFTIMVNADPLAHTVTSQIVCEIAYNAIPAVLRALVKDRTIVPSVVQITFLQQTSVFACRVILCAKASIVQDHQLWTAQKGVSLPPMCGNQMFPYALLLVPCELIQCLDHVALSVVLVRNNAQACVLVLEIVTVHYAHPLKNLVSVFLLVHLQLRRMNLMSAFHVIVNVMEDAVDLEMQIHVLAVCMWKKTTVVLHNAHPRDLLLHERFAWILVQGIFPSTTTLGKAKSFFQPSVLLHALSCRILAECLLAMHILTGVQPSLKRAQTPKLHLLVIQAILLHL